jgi:hypothetical protein
MPATTLVKVTCDKCAKTTELTATVRSGGTLSIEAPGWSVYTSGEVRCNDCLPSLCLSPRGLERRFWNSR